MVLARIGPGVKWVGPVCLLVPGDSQDPEESLETRPDGAQEVRDLTWEEGRGD